MRKIVWIVFAALAACWTGLVALSLALVDWVLGAVSSARVSSDMVLSPWPVPAWLAPWVDPGWLYALQTGMLALVDGLNHILPGAAAVGGWISVLGWIVWAFGIAGLLVLALVLHKIGTMRERAQRPAM